MNALSGLYEVHTPVAALRDRAQCGCRKRYFLPLSSSDFRLTTRVLIRNKTPGAWLEWEPLPLPGSDRRLDSLAFIIPFWDPSFLFSFFFTRFIRPGNVSGLHRRWASNGC